MSDPSHLTASRAQLTRGPILGLRLLAMLAIVGACSAPSTTQAVYDLVIRRSSITV